MNDGPAVFVRPESYRQITKPPTRALEALRAEAG